MRALAAIEHDPKTVIGIGLPLAQALERPMAGLRAFPGYVPPFPATQHAFWVFLAHGDASQLFDAGRALAARFRALLDVVDEVDAFVYRDGRDSQRLRGRDRKSQGRDAVRGRDHRWRGPGPRRRSFVAVQRWVHYLDVVDRLTAAERAAAVGRDQETDVELADAPESAHVKRTAQESFDPPAHILRRSMPYGGIREHGLNFVAFGESLDRFERQLRRMAGRDDGVSDGILAFTRAVSGAYYFCPPLRQGRCDLSAFGA